MADQNITALPVSDTPVSSDQLLLVGATEEKLIDYDKLADAILNKLTSKNFSLDQGTMPLIRALNELNSNRFFIPIKEGIRYKGDDSIMNVANIPNNTVYFRIIMMDEIHPVLLSSGGILVGYLLQPDYYRQMFYSSQVIASRTCYGGKWSDWQLITKL